ncbi:MAG: cytochrome ubiquinol oxidase subunit I [Aestuariivirga sp.]
MFNDITALTLARWQFAFTVSFHFIFPAISIGLASFLAVLKGLQLVTGETVYRDLFNFWKKIFAVAFGMGVVSGIVMAYQFGTNWSVFSDKAGPVIGPLMGYEVLTAFFLEAGFLGVMLFGEKRVGPGLHFFATLMVAIGTLISATWIIAANSWMHTPAGYSIAANGQFQPESWLAIIFNPSFPYRLVHTVLAAYLTTAFTVGGVGAWHLLRNQNSPAARRMFSMAMWMAVIVTPLQIIAGDQHGLNTLEYQPAKIAAMEGDYETTPGTPLILFGIPDDVNEVTRYAVEIPNLGALILTHDWNGSIKGLKEFPKDQRPPAAIIFWSFRIMVGLGMAMLGLGLWSLVRRFTKHDLYKDRWLQRASILMLPSGFIAVIAGWVTTEVGRQPYTVYGLLTTANSASPIAAPAVATSLLAFIIVYFLVFGAGIFYIFRLARSTPDHPSPNIQGPHHAAGITPGPALDLQGGASS